MSRTHVAITGAAGYIGSRIVSAMQREHPAWELTAIDNFYLGDQRTIGDVSVEHVDVRNRQRLASALDGADVVLHLAAISGVDDCRENADLAYEVNVQGTNNVAWWCRQHGAGLVFPYSMAVLGDPGSFPITIEHPREPLNWYGRTKLLGERAIDEFADGAFPAHQFMISNLYGHHRIDGAVVTKPTVINFFLDRALGGEPLTVYRPGTQSRNYVHVKDVADAYLRSTEVLLDQLVDGATGAAHFEIASDDARGVKDVADAVGALVRERTDRNPTVELVDNPRDDETLVESFGVETSRTADRLGWRAEYDVDDGIEEMLEIALESAE